MVREEKREKILKVRDLERVAENRKEKREKKRERRRGERMPAGDIVLVRIEKRRTWGMKREEQE